MRQITVVFLFTIAFINCVSAKYLVIFNDGPLAEVGSSRRERDTTPDKLDELVQAGAKTAFIKSYDDGSDGSNERGYHTVSDDKGNKGYRHYDSFHKKDGDKYGYETHSAFGYESGNENDAKGRYRDENNEKADGQFEDKQAEGKETQNAYKVVDDEGDSGDYTRGNVSENSEKYAVDGAAGDTENYETENANEYGTGNYESEGNLIHDGGNSPYTYDGETNTDSEHYSAADYEGDY